MKRTELLRLVRALAFPSLALGLHAQQAAPGSPSDADETIELPAFTVSSAQTNDYLASETVTGSRVATAIRDLPYNVSVITSEFIKDFAAFDISEQFAYTSGLSGRQQEGAYIIRGFFNGNQLRNGFKRSGLVDPSSIDRVEVIKGPAAAIYGQTSPGGTINIISKRPTEKPLQEIGVTYGTYEQKRIEFGTSGPLLRSSLGKTLYRVGGAIYDREFEQAYRDSHTRNLTLSAVQEFSKSTNLFVEYDFIDKHTRPGASIPYLTRTDTASVIDARTGLPATRTYTRNLGYTHELDTFSLQGPDEYLDRDMHTFSAFLEHRLNSIFSLRAATSLYNRHYYKSSMSGGTFNSVTRTIGTREPAYDVIDEWGRAAQVDLLARYATTAFTQMTHSTLLTFDYAFVGDDRASYRWLATELNSLPASVRNLNVDNPNYYIPLYSRDTYKRISSWTGSGTEVTGLFLRHNTNLFNEKLKLLAAVRYDSVEVDAKNKITTVRSSANPTATSPQLGVTYAASRALSVYYSYARSFVAQTATNNAGVILPNERGVSNEVGVKAGFFEHKLNFTLSLYDIRRNNVLVSGVVNTVPLLDTNGNPIIDTSTGQPLTQNITDTTTEGKDRSNGIDFDANWAVTPEWLVIGDVTYIDAEVVSGGTDIDRVGRRPREAPAWSFGTALKYSPLHHGLKGLTLTGGIRYRGEVYPNNRSGGLDLNNDGLVETNNGQRGITIPSYTKVDLGVTYRLKTAARWEHTIQLNVKNAFDKKFYDEDAFLGDRRVVLVSYGVKY